MREQNIHSQSPEPKPPYSPPSREFIEQFMSWFEPMPKRSVYARPCSQCGLLITKTPEAIGESFLLMGGTCCSLIDLTKRYICHEIPVLFLLLREKSLRQLERLSKAPDISLEVSGPVAARRASPGFLKIFVDILG